MMNEKKDSCNAVVLGPTRTTYFPDWLDSEPVEEVEKGADSTFPPPAAPVEEKAAAEWLPDNHSFRRNRFTVSTKPDWSAVKRAHERGYASHVVDAIADSWTELFWTKTESKANRLLADYKAKVKALGWAAQEFRIVGPNESRAAA